MPELSPYIKPLINGEVHFGQIPEVDRHAITAMAQLEVATARQNNSKFKDDRNGLSSHNELGGLATQAFVLGNMGAIRIGVLRVRKPIDKEVITSHEDILLDAVTHLGSYIAGYEPGAGSVVAYLARRSQANAQREAGQNSILAGWQAALAYTACIKLDDISGSRWQPLTHQDYLEAATSLPQHVTVTLRTPESRIARVQSLYNAIETLPLVDEQEPMKGRVLFDRQVDEFEIVDDGLSLEAEVGALNWENLTLYKKDLVRKHFGIEGVRKSKAVLAQEYSVSYQAIAYQIADAIALLKGEFEPNRSDKNQLARAVNGDTYAGPPLKHPMKKLKQNTA